MGLTDPSEQHTGADSGPLRVRELLRACGATRDRGERAELLARVALGLEQAADDIAADEHQAQQHREVIAGLRGQAGMARVAAALDGDQQEQHRPAC